MSTDANWPSHPNLQGGFAPQATEADVPRLEVQGEIPRELAGTLYRNGPNPQFPPRGGERYHWFDGDGMIHAISFAGGTAKYRNRWVRTRRFELERKAGKALFGGLRSMSHTDPDAWRELEARGLSSYERLKLAVDAANTNVIWHAGRLLALLEVELPTELDPRTLETVGRYGFAGRLTTEMTAHPKVDPETGELLFFGYSAEPPYLRYHVADRSGRLTRSVEVPRKVGTMMHDFVATRHHAIFPEFPVSLRPENLFSDELFRWEPELGTRIGVMPRDGGASDAIWFETEACFVYHFMNAHEAGSRITIDAVKYPRVALFPTGRPGDEEPGPAPGLLTRWTLDLETRSFREEPLDDVQIEFPRLDERRAGLGYRHGYAVGTLPRGDATLPFNAILHYDLATGARRAHALPDGSSAGEAVFVPRSDSAPEGDGFLLATVYRWAEDRSDVLVLDASNVEAAPLAVVRIPQRIPFGFHGNWAPGVTLDV
jgi:carotenoid cleavage dioxygenase-like enzyme